MEKEELCGSSTMNKIEQLSFNYFDMNVDYLIETSVEGGREPIAKGEGGDPYNGLSYLSKISAFSISPLNLDRE